MVELNKNPNPQQIEPHYLRALELLPEALREKALRGWLEEHAERQAREAERKAALRSQARLIALVEAHRENPKRDLAQALQTEAYQLLSLGSPLGGYSRLKQAGALLQGLPEAGPASLEPFLDAMLARLGHAPKGYALEVARTLLHLALEVGLERGYHPATSEVTFHLPQGALAGALWPEAKPETGRKRIQRALARLAGDGLLAFAPRVGNAIDHQTGKPLGWLDGTVFRVRLKAGPARPITQEELSHPWRDLKADMRQGRTFVKMSQLINKHLRGDSIIDQLKSWALPPAKKIETPLINWDTSVAAARNALQDVKHCAREERRHFVGEAGTLLARLLNDRQSADLYRGLLWGALRRLDRGADYFDALWNAINRVLVDLEERFARRPGALLVARLRESGLWELLMEGPMYRVA